MAKNSVVVKIPSEPTWDGSYNRSNIIEALNWYNINKDENDAAKYLGTKDLSLAKRYSSLAWAIRMQARGCVFPEKESATIQKQKAEYDSAVKALQPVNSGAPVNVVSIQERTAAKTDQFIGDLEGLIDDFGVNGKVEDLNAYQNMLDMGVKPAHANKIAEYFRERSTEISKAISGEDADLKEGYAPLGKKRLLNLSKVFDAIVSDAEKIAFNGKATRKPRKKKPVSAEKKVKTLKFLAREDSLKLQSIDPVRIIGTQQRWVYNTKTRKLGVYNAIDSSGLSIKGSTVQGYSDSSICKNLRKPEKVLKIVTEGGKIALRKVLDDVNSKPIKLNGRINKDTILLRVV